MDFATTKAHGLSVKQLFLQHDAYLLRNWIYTSVLFLLGLLSPIECFALQSIIVEPHIKYNVSQQADINLMRQYFREASWAIPGSDASWKLLKPLNISKARLINIESRDSLSFDPVTKVPHFDFSVGDLSAQLANCKLNDLIPHIIVGQVPQTSLLNKTEGGLYYGISDWKVYEEYAYAFLEFVTVENGFAEADFEVANEPDINGQTWLLGESVFKASPKMYDAYLKLYMAWANAADRLSRAHPELKFRVGGPAIGPYSFRPGFLNWADQFLSDVASKKLRLDFFSFHFYGLNQSLIGLPKFGRYPSINEFSLHIHDKMNNLGLAGIPIFVSEWGIHYDTGSASGIINGTNVGAAWMARFLLDAAESDIEEGALLTFIDRLIPPEHLENNWGWASLLHQDGGVPKPIYNVALMFTKLPDQRVKTTPVRQGSIGVIGAANASKVSILVFNQNWDFLKEKDLALSQQAQITLKTLPFAASKVTVIKYVMDETHANPYLIELNKSLNKSSILNAKTLRAVRMPQIPVVNGSVVLPVTDLAPSSVSLWEVLPAE